MDKNELTPIVKEMITSPSCCRELKEAGQQWLDAVDADAAKAAAVALLQEVREDILTIEQVIEFVESPQGTQIFGVERAKAIAEHAHEVKGKGEKWCDCTACAAGLKILDHASLLA